MTSALRSSGDPEIPMTGRDQVQQQRQEIAQLLKKGAPAAFLEHALPEEER